MDFYVQEVEMGHIIKGVPEDSLGAELALVPGDELLRINGEEVVDLIDYEALIATVDLTVTYLTTGKRWRSPAKRTNMRSWASISATDCSKPASARTTAFSALSTRCRPAAANRFTSRTTTGA